MPTREQMADAVGRLETLAEGRYRHAGLGRYWPFGNRVMPLYDAERGLGWKHLSRRQREDVLRLEMDWDGFTQGEIDAVERRVLDGRGAESWMVGIEPDGGDVGRIDPGAAAAEPVNLAPSDEPGIYQLWHIGDYRGRLLAAALGVEIDPDFPSGHIHVADVRADGLDHVFHLTQDGEWRGDPRVTLRVEDMRSTSVWDVIVAPDGQAHRVEGVGFEEIPTVEPPGGLDESDPEGFAGSREGREREGPPLEHVERQIRAMKAEPEIFLESTRRYVQPDPEDMDSVEDTCDTLGPWDGLKASEKLRVLEGEFDWSGVGDRQKEAVLAREVDFGEITRDQLDDVFGAIPTDVDERPARRLFDEANFERAGADHSGHGEQLATAREATRNLIESVWADEWPRAVAIMDFGLDSQEHYEALYYPIRNHEIGPAVLDAALGYGEKLTELARDAPSNPHKGIRFHTAWDDLLGRGRPDSARPRGQQATDAPDAESSGRRPDGAAPSRVGTPPASLTESILSTPEAFLPGSNDGNERAHDPGPERGR